MKTLTLKTHLTKAALLGALTIVPALALTSSAQAAPARRGNPAPSWNNTARYQTPRFDSRSNTAARVWAPRPDQNHNDGRFDDARNNSYRNDERFDSRRDYDNRGRNQNNSNDTGKIIGAGIVGAILGAVLSH